MAALGSFTLLVAFIACAYAASASVAGARRRSPRVIESGIGAFYLVTALMTLATAILVHAFVTYDYTIRYVDRYSDSVQPLLLQTDIVLGWPGRVDHVLGLPAVGLRRDRRQDQP